MAFLSRLFWPLAFCLLLSAGSFAWAQNDNTLHVIRPLIHAEQDKPELCLEFDHALDGNDHSRIENNVRLEADGKNIPVTPQNLSVVGSLMCVVSLDYRREYRLIVTNLRGGAGEKLTESYRLSFTVPDRHPSLAFASDQYNDGLMRWRDNDPVLHAVNVPRVKIELYHITDPALMTEAWRQRLQTTLAPSESAYFARHNGQLVWQGDIILDDTTNKILEQKVPLHATAGSLSPGLYLVAASAPAAKRTADEIELAPLAASWLLRSDLNIHALRGADRYYATADKSDASTALKDVRFILEDKNQQSLAEARSDADGIALLPVAADKIHNATTLIGMTGTNDVGFVDLTDQGGPALTLSELNASLATDKKFYAPGTNATVTYTAYDAHDRPALPSDTRLQILRPDHSVYLSLPVPKDQNGVAHMQVPVPVGNGAWSLVWQQADGRQLGETPLRITTNDDAPHLDMSSERAALANDGDVALTLKSVTASGAPASTITGRINIAWIAPDHIFSGWDGYHFGNGERTTMATTSVASFMTDEKGEAQLHINLPPPPGTAALYAVLITAVSDPAAGAADPVPLTLPLKPKDFVIGIKPLTMDGKFGENSMAHFDIIGLDTDGKRRAVDGLSYQIYEEGRSFDWYQADGRWDYKQQQQRRRIGGGALNIKADTTAPIEWRVTAGTYRLDITDSSGAVLARMDFSAGWGSTEKNVGANAVLPLSATTPSLHVDETATVHFKLDQGAMVTAIVADDHIRKVFHAVKPPGDNEINFTPDADWGKKISILVTADSTDGDGKPSHVAGQLFLPFGKALASEKTATLAVQEALSALDIKGATLPVLKVGDQIELAIGVTNNNAPPGVYHYTFTAPLGVKLTGAASGSFNLLTRQSHTLALALNALQTGAKDVRLEITGPRNTHANQSWPLAITPVDVGLSDASEVKIAPQQIWPLQANDKTHAKLEPGFVFASPQPLSDMPQILATTLQLPTFTTREIVDETAVLQLWHDIILQADLLNEQNLMLRQHHLLIRLLTRQGSDGGFMSLPGADEDMASTTAAVTILGSIDQPLVKPALDQAADWLKRRLSNNWFDEKERPERAAAYAALASANRLDVASLHYFSDTSADKSLPSLASLQLASAFARANDQDKAGFWLNAAQIEKGSPDIAPELLPYLAENNAFDSRDLLPALEKLTSDKTKSQPQRVLAIYALHALWHLQNRAGIWRINVNNSDQAPRSVFVTPLPETTGNLTLRNKSDKPFFVTEAHSIKVTPPKDDSIIRHIYRLSGNEVGEGEPLTRHETYIVVVEGAEPNDASDSTLIVRDNPGPALLPVSCALGSNLDVNESLAWIKNLSLSESMACEKSNHSLDILLAHKDSDAKTWRVGYLAEAEWGGNFSILPPRIRLLTDGKQSPATTRQGRTSQIHVQ